MTREKIRETLERLDRLANTPQFMLVDEASETARDALALLRLAVDYSHTIRIADVLADLDRERKAVSS